MPMSIERLLSILAEQIGRARAVALKKGPKGPEERHIEAVIESLRKTFACVAEGYDPRELGARAGFVCDADDRLQHFLRLHGRPVPVDGVWVEHLLSLAGVELVPGQAILVEPALAREMVETALGPSRMECESERRDQGFLFQRQVRLLAAAFAARDMMESEAIAHEHD